jgi:hypothetical protein
MCSVIVCEESRSFYSKMDFGIHAFWRSDLSRRYGGLGIEEAELKYRG